MGEDFVDDDVLLQAYRQSICGAGRTALHRAGCPRLRIVLTVTRAREHHRVARAVRCHRPRRLVRVINLEHDAAGFFAQAQGAAFVGEVVRESTQHAADAVGGFDVRRNRRDDEEAVALNNGVVGEGVVDVAREPPAADVLKEGIGIVDLDKLRALSVSISERVKHDLGEGQAGATGRWPKRFVAALRRAKDGERQSCHAAGDGTRGIRDDNVIATGISQSGIRHGIAGARRA